MEGLRRSRVRNSTIRGPERVASIDGARRDAWDATERIDDVSVSTVWNAARGKIFRGQERTALAKLWLTSHQNQKDVLKDSQQAAASSHQKIGGIAALIEAATFIFGFVLLLGLLTDYTTGSPSVTESVEFVVDNQGPLFAWYLAIYIFFGVALVPLVIAMYERIRAGSLILAQTAAVFGFIWAVLVLASGMIAIIGLDTVSELSSSNPGQAEAVWSSLDAVQNALGGGNEIVGGIWILLVSVGAMRAASMPNVLNYLGMIAGIAGIVTIVPALEDVGAIFGLGLIVWFIWAGLRMIRGRSDQTRE